MIDIDLSAYDTDKSSEYLANYEREFGDRFADEIALLELGVQRGGSMRLWLDLLPNAQIAGLDLNEIEVPDSTGRLHVYRGFQQDPAILNQIAADIAPGGFDIIVDDASHLGTYTAESFWHLFPRHLKSGGVYVLDDWGCGYWPAWADGHAYTGSRAALGDFGVTGTPSALKPNRLEALRRKIRTSARPIANRLPTATREKLEKVYTRFDGVTVKGRFRSHDYGMVGFVKQLVDATSVRNIDVNKDSPFDNEIASVHVYASQVFVHKR
jgi:SAM-dependent methyltransferase